MCRSVPPTDLVSTPVSCECNLATRRLTRRWGYAAAGGACPNGAGGSEYVEAQTGATSER